MTLYQKVIETPEKFDFTISTLGERKLSSPIKGREFATEDRVLFSQSDDTLRKLLADGRPLVSLDLLFGWAWPPPTSWSILMLRRLKHALIMQ